MEIWMGSDARGVITFARVIRDDTRAMYESSIRRFVGGLFAFARGSQLGMSST